jgi:hypothetical protein
MPREVIRVGVGNERPRLRFPWVQPQVELWQMQAALESNVNQSAGRLNPDFANRQGKPGSFPRANPANFNARAGDALYH